MWKLTSASNGSWTLWIEPQLSLFVFSLSSLLLVSASLDCFSLFRCTHTASSTPPFTSSPSSWSLWSPCCSYCQTTSTSTMWWTNTLRTSAEDLGTLAENEPPTHPGILQRQQALTLAWLAWLGNRWLRHRQSALFTTFTQERQDPASRWQAYHSPEESLLSCQSLFVGHVRTGRPVSDDFGSLISTSGKIHVATQKMSKSGFSLNDKKSRFSLIIEQGFRNTSSRPIMTEEISKNWMGLSSLNEVKYLSCSSRRRSTSTRSTTSSRTVIGTKLGSSWCSWEKSQ